MALARIIGPANQQTEWLKELLRARGYDVEVTPWVENGSVPPALEIEVATCTVEEALAQANAYAQNTPEAQIFVAAGVLPEPALKTERSQGAAARVVAWVSGLVHRKASLQTIDIQPSAAIPAADSETLSRRAAGPEPDRGPHPATPGPEPGTTPAFASVSPLPLTFEVPSNPTSAEQVAYLSSDETTAHAAVGEQKSAETTTPAVSGEASASVLADERLRWHSVLRRHEQMREAALERRAEEERQREREQARLEREAEIIRRNREAETEVMQMASEIEQSSAVQAKAAPDELKPAENAAVHSNLEPPVQEIWPPVQATTLEIRLRVLRDFEQRQRAALAAKQAEKAPVHVPETLPPAPEPPVIAAAPVSAVSPPVTAPPLKKRAPARRAYAAKRGRRSSQQSQRAREWRAAVVTASLLTVVLMGAWSLATNPRPAAPLTPRELQQSDRIEQQVPFGPVRLVNSQPNSPAPQPLVKSTGQPPQAPLRQASAPAPVRSQKPSAYHGGRSVSRSRHRTNVNRDRMDVNNDVVIRRFQLVPRPPAPSQAQANLKRFSDTD